MPETTMTPHTTRPGRWMTPFLLACVVAIFAICFALAPKAGSEDGEAFGGTDSKVTDVLAEHGVTPWFTPLFEPGSGEIESGLFALQAALGAGTFGFVLGNLRGRKAERERLTATSTITPAGRTPAAEATPVPGAAQA